MKINLENCPVMLRDRVAAAMEDAQSCGICELIFVEKRIGTPYRDKSLTTTTYEVIVLHGNLFRVFTQMDDGGPLRDRVFENSLILATVQNILHNAPEWAGLVDYGQHGIAASVHSRLYRKAGGIPKGRRGDVICARLKCTAHWERPRP